MASKQVRGRAAISAPRGIRYGIGCETHYLQTSARPRAHLGLHEPPCGGAMKIPEIIVVRTVHRPGSLARVLNVLGEAGIVVEGLTARKRDHEHTVWEISVDVDAESNLDLAGAIDALDNAEVLGKSDRVFNRHRGGKIQVQSRQPVQSLEMLRDVYTPGVARVCLALAEDPQCTKEFTALGRTVAIATNGTAILGLGDIGPVAGMPVMEGKAALMSELAGLSGVPLLVERRDVEGFVEAVAAVSASFGAIQLEDVAAPECFDIEAALVERLNKPVMHDDRHGTAVVVLAGLLSAARAVDFDLSASVIGQVGLGAAGIGICELLQHYGVSGLLGADLDPRARQRLERLGGRPAELERIMQEADVVIATTGVKNLIRPEMIRPGQVIFALSNPEPEIEPEAALARGARFATDGKIVNNVLGFPGIFRGALDADAPRITVEMLLAAADALSARATADSLVPDPLELEVHAAVARAVAAAGPQVPPRRPCPTPASR